MAPTRNTCVRLRVPIRSEYAKYESPRKLTWLRAYIGNRFRKSSLPSVVLTTRTVSAIDPMFSAVVVLQVSIQPLVSHGDDDARLTLMRESCLPRR